MAKIMSLAVAIAAAVHDGDSVATDGFTDRYRTPPGMR